MYVFLKLDFKRFVRCIKMTIVSRSLDLDPLATGTGMPAYKLIWESYCAQVLNEHKRPAGK
jgi:hypothetical protein